MVMRDSRLVFPSLASALALVLGVACSEGTNEFEDGDRGGSTGGVAGSGVSGSSGTAGNAGSTSSGGATSGTGGAGVTGGADATGGTSAGSGPVGGMGGTASGAGGTGGGSAGMGTSGAGGMAPTSGCAAATWPPGDGTTLLSIDVDGTPREYIVQIPSNYDTNHPYRFFLEWHGRKVKAVLMLCYFL
jgi:hypothetical protein